MLLFILYGGELVFAFLFGRIALWMWRSRETVRALWREWRDGPPEGPSGPGTPKPIALPRPARAVAQELRPAA